MEKASLVDKQRIARYLLYLIFVGEVDGLANKILNDKRYSSLFSVDEIQEIRRALSTEDLDIPNLLLDNDWGIAPTQYTRKNYYFFDNNILKLEF